MLSRTHAGEENRAVLDVHVSVLLVTIRYVEIWCSVRMYGGERRIRIRRAHH